jgi:hypothetical protein
VIVKTKPLKDVTCWFLDLDKRSFLINPNILTCIDLQGCTQCFLNIFFDLARIGNYCLKKTLYTENAHFSKFFQRNFCNQKIIGSTYQVIMKYIICLCYQQLPFMIATWAIFKQLKWIWVLHVFVVFIGAFHKLQHTCVKVLHEVVETICLMKPNINDAQSLFQHKLHARYPTITTKHVYLGIVKCEM